MGFTTFAVLDKKFIRYYSSYSRRPTIAINVHVYNLLYRWFISTLLQQYIFTGVINSSEMVELEKEEMELTGTSVVL